MLLSCHTCEADLPESDTQPGAGTLQGQLVHLHDTGPAHQDVIAHPVLATVPYGRGYQRPSATRTRDLFEPPFSKPRKVPGVITWTDVSEWQAAHYDNSYPWPVAAYRVSLGTSYTDAKVGPNSAWCHGTARLTAHIGYHVWYPGNEAGQVARFFAILGGALDSRTVAMIDVESWSGQISGDHSAQLNTLATLFAQRLGSHRVKAYGNSGDLAALWPHRLPWIGVVKAGYSSSPPPEPWDGWQYTDGGSQWPVPSGWSRASAPFGACDHNAFYGTTAQFAAAWIGTPTPAPTPTPTPKPPVQEDTDMLFVTIDRKTVATGQTWPGDFLQGSDLRMYHLVTPASAAAYAAKLPNVTITMAEYTALVAAGLVVNPVAAKAVTGDA